MKKMKQYIELYSISGISEIYCDASDSQTEQSEGVPERVETDEIIATEKIIDSPPAFPATPVNKDNANIEGILAQNKISYANCAKCMLHQNRKHFVYGEGNPNAKMMIIGEGPGEEENKQGKPFVGRAGQLLTRMLAAINIAREDVYITNIVKCQPPGNRNPQKEEVDACIPYLKEQIKLIKPQILFLLGKVAAETLLGTNDLMKVMRTQKFSYEGIDTYVSYHPAALLRNPSFKKLSWIDLQALQKVYDNLSG